MDAAVEMPARVLSQLGGPPGWRPRRQPEVGCLVSPSCPSPHRLPSRPQEVDGRPKGHARDGSGRRDRSCRHRRAAPAKGYTVGDPQPELAPFSLGAAGGGTGSGAVLPDGTLVLASLSATGTSAVVCTLHPGGRQCASTATLGAYTSARARTTSPVCPRCSPQAVPTWRWWWRTAAPSRFSPALAGPSCSTAPMTAGPSPVRSRPASSKVSARPPSLMTSSSSPRRRPRP